MMSDFHKFLVAVTIPMILGLSAWVLLSGSPIESADIPAFKEVVVVNGDTLWSIAVREAPQVDPRKTVWQIRNINQMQSATIYPGQRIKVPN